MSVFFYGAILNRAILIANTDRDKRSHMSQTPVRSLPLPPAWEPDIENTDIQSDVVRYVFNWASGAWTMRKTISANNLREREGEVGCGAGVFLEATRITYKYQPRWSDTRALVRLGMVIPDFLAIPDRELIDAIESAVDYREHELIFINALDSIDEAIDRFFPAMAERPNPRNPRRNR